MNCQLRAALKLLLHLMRNDASAIDAAHIIPWSLSHDDAPRNGMALCRLCHWTFDKGLLTVSARYHVVASPQLSAQLVVSLSNGITPPATYRTSTAKTSSARPNKPSGPISTRSVGTVGTCFADVKRGETTSPHPGPLARTVAPTPLT